MVYATHHPRHPARPGMTLVEVMFCVVVMSTMLVAAFGAVGASVSTRIAQRDSSQGMALARQLMAEILQTRYKDLVNPIFGIEAGDVRATFDDVDDYDGLQESNAQFADGTAIPGGTGWKRKVIVDWVSPTDPTQKVNTDQGLKRILVKVSNPAGKTFVLYGLRSNSDRYEYIPGSQVTYTCWAGVSLQVGTTTSGRNVQGVNLVNLSP
jgi:MSHA pilin protein MshD